MRSRSRVYFGSLVVAGVSLAVAAPASSGVTASSFTWTQRPVAAKSSFTEPSIAVSPDGGTTTVSAPGGGGVQYWVTKNGGASFTHRVTQGGGGDSELDFQPDGSLLSADLAITTSVIQRSTNGGLTFTRQQDAGGEQDRQWFAHRGSAEQFLVYHDFVAEREYFVRSRDGGRTWGSQEDVNSPDQFTGTLNQEAKPGDTASLVDQGYNTFSGPMFVDQATGEMYVLYSISSAQDNATSVGGFGPTRGIVAAHSSDDGKTWTNKYAVVNGGLALAGGNINGAIFPWGALGPDGTIYVFYNASTDGHFHTYYTYSTDKTATWSTPVRVDGLPLNRGSTVYVTGVAGAAPGVLDMAWFQTDNGVSPDDQSGRWHVDFAQIRQANTAAPSISRSRISDHIIHHGSICQKGILCVRALGDDRSLGDFFELTVGPDGMAQVAWSDNGNVVKPQPADRRIFYARQTGGRSAN